MLLKLEKKLNTLYISLSLITLLALISYSNSFTVPFTLDDFSSIQDNYAIYDPFNISAIWKFYTNRFILYFTISINYFFHDNAVYGYHIVNLLIHILNGILIYLIFKRILSLDYFKYQLTGKFKNFISLLSSLLFVCHPLQINAVTYIIQRTASLAACFCFLAIFFYLKFRMEQKLRFFLICLLFIILAMFTKENTITLPFMIIFLELILFIKSNTISWKTRILLILMLLITVPIIPCTNLYLGGYNQSDTSLTFKASTNMDRMEYFYTELNVIVHYIKLLFLPINQNFDYSNDYPMSKTIWQNYSYISFIILSIIGTISLINIRKNKLIAIGIIWFFVGLSVESSFFSIKDVYFEHRLYFPLAGFIMAITGIVFHKFGNKRKSLIQKAMLYYIAVMLMIIPLFSALTIYRNYIFSDGVRLWSDVVKKAPNSDRAYSVLATNLLNAYEDNTSRKDYLIRSEEEFKKAIQMNYGNSTAHCNLSKVYYLENEYSKSIDEAKITLQYESSVYAYLNLGLSLKALGDLSSAKDEFLKGYDKDPKFTAIIRSLGDTYKELGDFENAKKYYEEFLKKNRYVNDNNEVKKEIDSLSK